MSIAGGSSSPELSTPPGSPDLAPSSGTSAANSNGHGTIHVLGGAHPPAPTSAAKINNAATSAPATTAPKKQRKKREPAAAANANANGEEKPKPVRRQRQPKDPNAPPPQRKKRKTAAEKAAEAAAAASTPTPAPAPAPAPAPEEKPASPQQPPQQPPVTQQQPQQQPQQPPQQQQQAAPRSRQPKITDLVGAASPAQPNYAPQPQPSPYEPLPNPAVAQVAAANQSPFQSNSRPASSGQLYDPIRSSTVPVSQNHHASSIPPVSPPARVINRASASPSINSLIDPPTISNQSHIPQQSRFQPPMSVTSAPASPAPQPAKHNPFGPPSETAQASKPPPMNSTPMEGVEQSQPAPQPAAAVAPVPKKAESAGSSSAAVTPPVPQKSSKPKDAQPPPLPGGGGLLSGMPFGGASKGSGTEGTNIWLTFPLKGQTNVTINFAREVEKKYGFAALHPRVAAARERRRQMAAATAALERGSGAASADDMSVDLSENESNVEMGGVEDDLTQDGKKRQRRKKVEDYDKEDDFIDDTELAWEQSALMAKDGFFVYSGPLITEGEKPAVERADGTVARGRGRGRGRGGAARGETAANRGGRTAGGRGSRGGMTTRKPRVTKADRAMMEQEKIEREKMAATLAAKPMAPYPSTVS